MITEKQNDGWPCDTADKPGNVKLKTGCPGCGIVKTIHVPKAQKKPEITCCAICSAQIIFYPGEDRVA